jgi:hypothetical protein
MIADMDFLRYADEESPVSGTGACFRTAKPLLSM